MPSGEHQTGILTTKTILMVKISSEKIVLYDDNILLHCYMLVVRYEF